MLFHVVVWHTAVCSTPSESIVETAVFCDPDGHHPDCRSTVDTQHNVIVLLFAVDYERYRGSVDTQNIIINDIVFC